MMIWLFLCAFWVALLGSALEKAACKHVVEIKPSYEQSDIFTWNGYILLSKSSLYNEIVFLCGNRVRGSQAARIWCFLQWFSFKFNMYITFPEFFFVN